MDLLAAACRRDLCERIAKIAKLAKLKIAGIVPAAVGLERILGACGKWREGQRKKGFRGPGSQKPRGDDPFLPEGHL